MKVKSNNLKLKQYNFGKIQWETFWREKKLKRKVKERENF